MPTIATRALIPMAIPSADRAARTGRVRNATMLVAKRSAARSREANGEIAFMGWQRLCRR